MVINFVFLKFSFFFFVAICDLVHDMLTVSGNVF